MINVYKALGIMSGTSLDGLDLAVCTFKEGELNKWEYSINHACTIDYPKRLIERLKNSTNLSGLELVQLQNDWTNFVATAVNEFKEDKKEFPEIIGNHGHTVFHQPEIGLTYQLANNAALAAKTGCTVIGDFRSVDVALGGEGARLVPIGDDLLFHQFDACLNLGGIANISYKKEGKRLAFDCSPFNIPFNYYAQLLDQPYDKSGHLAASGVINHDLKAVILALPYFKKSHPKSLGIEWIKSVIYPITQSYKISQQDILATLSATFATVIAEAINKSKAKQVLITGGGAYNDFFIEQLRLLTDSKLQVPEKKVIDFKEALIFAFLAVLRIREEKNTLREVTGAKKSHRSGGLYLP